MMPLTPMTNRMACLLEVREVAAEKLETIKLVNLVPPIRFESGVAAIPDSTVTELRDILEGMRDRRARRRVALLDARTSRLARATTSRTSPTT
jgi:hypothetical protein